MSGPGHSLSPRRKARSPLPWRPPRPPTPGARAQLPSAPQPPRSPGSESRLLPRSTAVPLRTARCCRRQSFPPAWSAPPVEAQRPLAAPSSQEAASSVRRCPFQPRQGPLEPPGQPCPAGRPPERRRRQPRPQAQQHPPATEPGMDSPERSAAMLAFPRRSRRPSTTHAKTQPQESPTQQRPTPHHQPAILLPHQASHLNHL